VFLCIERVIEFFKIVVVEDKGGCVDVWVETDLFCVVEFFVDD